MRIKRFYKTPAGWVKRINVRLANGQLIVPHMKEGECLNPPTLDYVELQHTGVSAEQNFSDTMIEGAMREGWASFDESGVLVLDVRPALLRYKILRATGRHCLFCGLQMPYARDDDEHGRAMREHINSQHAGMTSPDSNNPSGYKVVHGFECRLDEDQHAEWNFHAAEARRLDEARKAGV